MKEDSKSTETTSRRDFTKAVITAAVAAPIAAALASCRREPPQSNSSGQATPAVQPSPTPSFNEGTPITVGGGGGNLKKDQTEEPNVSCRFIEEHFPADPQNPERGKKKFKNKNGWKMRTFKIRSRGSWEDYSDKLPSNGLCTVVIKCAGGNDNDVLIEGGVFGLEMNTDRYQKITDGHYRNPNAGHYIKQVILSSPQGFLLNKSFDQADECKVCTDSKKPNQSECPPDGPETS